MLNKTFRYSTPRGSDGKRLDKKNDSRSLTVKKMKKEGVTRTDVIDYLMESGFTNNPVSSEVLIDNMSDAWLTSIVDELQG